MASSIQAKHTYYLTLFAQTWPPKFKNSVSSYSRGFPISKGHYTIFAETVKIAPLYIWGQTWTLPLILNVIFQNFT